jgi:hypothetical protein
MSEQRTGQKVCHIKIAEVAKSAASHLYDTMMEENCFYEMWKKQNPDATPKQLEQRFVQKNWTKCIDFARTTLTLMLTKDDVSEGVKDEIMEILEQDQSIRGKHVSDTPLTKAH